MVATSGRAEISGIERQLIKLGKDTRAQFFQTRRVI